MKETSRNAVRVTAMIFILMITTATGYYFFHRTPAVFSGKERSIVIVPFGNHDNRPDGDYFSEGLAAEIADGLSRLADIRIIARPTAIRYRGSSKSPGLVGRETHAAAVLEGDVSRGAGRLVVSVRLINTEDEKEIWSAQFERPMKDVFAVEAEITGTIAEKLSEVMTRKYINGLARRPTDNLEAYDQYLQGRYFYSLRAKAALRKGIAFFSQAVAMDSGFSKAYSGLADCYAALAYGSYEPPAAAFGKAEAAANTALRLDSTLAEPHASLGYIRFYFFWDWKGAESEFLTAIRLNPGYTLAYQAYGYFLTARERFPEARSVFEKALSLDPLSGVAGTDLGFHLYYAGDYPAADAVLRSALAINPGSPLAHLWLGRSLQEEKRYASSIEQFLGTLSANPEWPVALAAAGYVYGISGQTSSAKKILDRLLNDSSSMFVTPYGFALLFAALGDRKSTYYWLERAYRERSNWMVWLKLDPRWARFRNEPRFLDLVGKIGLLGPGKLP